MSFVKRGINTRASVPRNWLITFKAIPCNPTDFFSLCHSSSFLWLHANLEAFICYQLLSAGIRFIGSDLSCYLGEHHGGLFIWSWKFNICPFSLVVKFSGFYPCSVAKLMFTCFNYHVRNGFIGVNEVGTTPFLYLELKAFSCDIHNTNCNWILLIIRYRTNNNNWIIECTLNFLIIPNLVIWLTYTQRTKFHECIPFNRRKFSKMS